jgi:hypothetical protein
MYVNVIITSKFYEVERHSPNFQERYNFGKPVSPRKVHSLARFNFFSEVHITFMYFPRCRDLQIHIQKVCKLYVYVCRRTPYVNDVYAKITCGYNSLLLKINCKV